MILGIDIGTGLTKGALVQDGKFIWGTKVPTEANPTSAVQKIMDVVKNEKGLEESDLDGIILTGWGQVKVPNRQGTELMSSIARAALWDCPSAKAVLCMGAQESLVIKLNDAGKVAGYARNDKCASGAGRFLEIICEALECTVDDLAALAAKADKEIRISNQCAVFTESEVVSLVNDGESIENIVAAILTALTVNIASLCKRTIKKEKLVLGGGLAKNEKICRLLQEALGVEIHVFQPEADYIAAVGAALSADGGRK
ncbi:acyl-CoA dehydratase activase [Dehalobacter sp. DCM]|uniref:acyl-CoA dehydratase activase n=1 Tax=Dehalobacter sp. DCM TaxID=2907827 RepID=UPI00308182B9|nr:acyl-CoA dehydratase activase [Dehalobacter sp. DCM]